MLLDTLAPDLEGWHRGKSVRRLVRRQAGPRRAQDPLAELVKIDPKSIGVGLYQHDMNRKELRETLIGLLRYLRPGPAADRPPSNGSGPQVRSLAYLEQMTRREPARG